MKKASYAVSALALVLAACAPPREGTDGGAVDLTPPVLLSVTAPDPRRLELTFDEIPSLTPGVYEVEPSLTVTGATVTGNTVRLDFDTDQEIGREYRLRLAVEDESGNGLWLLIRFYGFNPSPPRLCINEFTTQGSPTHPDLVEIKVMSGGNLGGETFCHGTATLYAYRFVFPALTVAPGEFILLHTKPEGIPEEIDESGEITASGGRDASAEAFDFWVRDGSGLSGNNGAISLYASPNGPVLDAVLYSTRTSDADTAWRGFGSADLRDQADDLVRSGAWIKAGEEAVPEDAVNPEDSTATRSICRTSDSLDTNGKGDFHIVPTKKSSFGRDNTDEVFIR
jgi:hypothetical protein